MKLIKLFVFNIICCLLLFSCTDKVKNTDKTTNTTSNIEEKNNISNAINSDDNKENIDKAEKNIDKIPSDKNPNYSKVYATLYVGEEEKSIINYYEVANNKIPYIYQLQLKNVEEYPYEPIYEFEKHKLKDIQKLFGGKVTVSNQDYHTCFNPTKFLCYKDTKKKLTYWFLTGPLVEDEIIKIIISTLDNDNKNCVIPKEEINLSFLFNIYKNLNKAKLLSFDEGMIDYEHNDEFYFPMVGDSIDDIKTYFNNKNLKLINQKGFDVIAFTSNQNFYKQGAEHSSLYRISDLYYILKNNKVVGLSVSKYTGN